MRCGSAGMGSCASGAPLTTMLTARAQEVGPSSTNGRALPSASCPRAWPRPDGSAPAALPGTAATGGAGLLPERRPCSA